MTETPEKETEDQQANAVPDPVDGYTGLSVSDRVADLRAKIADLNEAVLHAHGNDIVVQFKINEDWANHGKQLPIVADIFARL